MVPAGPVRIVGATLLWLVLSCGRDASAPAEHLRLAEELWRKNDIGAYAAYRGIDPDSAAGQAARRALRDAEAHYREAIRRLQAGEAGASQEMLRGRAVAPMDPALYLPLARASRDQGLLLRAAEFYRQFLLHQPDGPLADAARDEAQRLDPELAQLAQLQPLVRPAPRASPLARWSWIGIGVAVGLGLAVLGALRRLRGGVSLPQIAQQRPEAHPALTYHLGGLRHELLKHRIAAVRPAVQALHQGAAGPAARAYLMERLYGEAPLRAAWDSHLRALHRALGLTDELLRGDPALRRAHRAVRRIAALEQPLRRDPPGAAPRLLRALDVLHGFERDVAGLCGRLSRTEVTAALLREVVDSIRGESAGRPPVDEVLVAPPPVGLYVDVYRSDLLLVLRNVVRNAVYAAAQAPPPRRVALEVQPEVQPTGEETVRIRVLDTSPASSGAAALHERRPDQGLGLVTAALSLYRGGIDEEAGPLPGGYAKAVTVWLFRALDDEPDAPAPAERVA